MVSRSSSVGYTIMGKTADLTVVQRRPLTPCTRRARHKRSLQKRLAVHRALCPNITIITVIQYSTRKYKLYRMMQYIISRCSIIGVKMNISNFDNDFMDLWMYSNLMQKISVCNIFFLLKEINTCQK